MISSSLGRCSSAAVQRRAARTAAGCARAPLSSSHGRTGSGALCTRAAGSSIGVNASAAGGAAARAAAAAALAAALVLGGGGAPAWAALGPQPRGDVAALAAAAAGDDVMDQYDADMEQLADVVDPEVAMPKELQDFLKLFEKGTPRDLGKLEAAREKVGFRRAADGRVFLLSDGGEEFAVKADMQAPGYLLLRDGRGFCYYLPADPSGRLAQIDLSDDVLVAQLFANGLWEDILEPLEIMKTPEDANASAGGAVQLRLSEAEFRGVISLLQGAMELPEEALEDLEEFDQQ